MTVAHRRLWSLVWLPLGAVCCFLGLMLTHPGPVLVAVVLVGGSGATTAIPVGTRMGSHAVTDLSRTAARRGVLTGLAVLALWGWCALLHALVVPILLLALLTSPWAVDRVRRHLRRPARRHHRRPPPPEQEAAPPLPLPTSAPTPTPTPTPTGHRPERTDPAEPLAPLLRGITDDILCRAWQRSYFVLQEARSEDDRLDVVTLRAALLDEMERRHRAGVHEWLASGARAGSNPARFLVGEPDTGSDPV